MKNKKSLVEYDLFAEFENVDSDNVITGAVTQAVASATRPAKIEDFGEKIGGARKDLYEAYHDLLRNAAAKEFEKLPLSKSFPAPNYLKLLERGVERWKVDAVRALRDSVPKKPARRSWIIREWVEAVQSLRDIAVSVLENKWTQAEFRAELDKIAANDTDYRFGLSLNEEIVPQIKDFMLMYEILGHESDCSSLKFDRIYSYKQEQAPNDTIALREREKPGFCYRLLCSGETKEDALTRYKMQDRHEEKIPREKKNPFKVYSWRHSNYYFVGCKVANDYVELKAPFADFDAAADYRDSHLAELEELLKKYREVPYEREAENTPRTGKLRRTGNVTPEEFQTTFGFRGVEFGEWVENKNRQENLNQAYDALTDLAEVLNLPTRALSLNGILGLAFGARGRGGKNAPLAHYEHEKAVINLTKKNGAGSLGHEWFHALDNYFGRQEIHAAVSMITRNTKLIFPRNISPEIVEALRLIRNVLKNSKLRERCRKLDKRRNTEYWTLPEEMAARSFEVYLREKLRANGIRNDYLVNYRSEDSWQQATESGVKMDETYPYPTADEIEDIKAAYDYLFDSIRFKAHDKEYELYSASSGKISDMLRETELLLPQELTTEQQILKKMSESVFGIEVKYFNGAPELHGRFDEDADIIYLNVKAETSIDWTFWHEAFHVMKNHAPELYADILSHVERHDCFSSQQIESYRAAVHQPEMSNAAVVEEMLADAFADMKTGRRIVDEMAEENLGLAKKFAAFTKKLLAGVKKFFRAEETVEKYPEVALTDSQFKNFVARIEENCSLQGETVGDKILRAGNIHHSPYEYSPTKQKKFDTEAAATLTKKFAPEAVRQAIQELSPLGHKDNRYSEEVLREVRSNGR